MDFQPNPLKQTEDTRHIQLACTVINSPATKNDFAMDQFVASESNTTDGVRMRLQMGSGEKFLIRSGLQLSCPTSVDDKHIRLLSENSSVIFHTKGKFAVVSAASIKGANSPRKGTNHVFFTHVKAPVELNPVDGQWVALSEGIRSESKQSVERNELRDLPQQHFLSS